MYSCPHTHSSSLGESYRAVSVLDHKEWYGKATFTLKKRQDMASVAELKCLHLGLAPAPSILLHCEVGSKETNDGG